MGNATFQSGKDSGADASPNFGLVRDFNGDRLSDVAIVNLQSNDLSILFGRGDGTFQYPPRNYRTPSGPFAVAIFRVSSQEAEEPGLAVVERWGRERLDLFAPWTQGDHCTKWSRVSKPAERTMRG